MRPWLRGECLRVSRCVYYHLIYSHLFWTPAYTVRKIKDLRFIFNAERFRRQGLYTVRPPWKNLAQPRA